MSCFWFYFLSFTYGAPVTLAGCAVAAFMRIIGAKRKKVGFCLCFEYGKIRGGFSLGPFIFVGCDSTEHILWHEHGHGIQNIIFGPLMPALVSIPSAARYWYRRLKKDKTKLPPYEKVWFEAQATKFGEQLHKRFKCSE